MVQAPIIASLLLATAADPLDERFATQVRPVVERYCIGCHGARKPKGDLDLGRDTTAAAVAAHVQQWGRVLERLRADEMPPEDASRQPTLDERQAMMAWIRDFRDREARRHAGDPGPVFARRLSNAEYDYSIRDLTGIDIRPTREFPVDPANEAGFDNSGESLAMSPALVKKYLEAARRVADHVVLKPEGFVFAPHPAVTETDRDKYCVQRILDFYRRHRVDLADYFLAAWKCRRGGEPARVAAAAGLSPKYLALVWSALTEEDGDAGPLAGVRQRWRELSEDEPAARAGCERLRDWVVRLRGLLQPDVPKLKVKGMSEGSQPFILWRNRQLAIRHRTYAGQVFADFKKLVEHSPELAPKEADTEPRLRAALERFCKVFPDAFVVIDRGPYFDAKQAGKGRPLTAGFHLMQGYFRDDGPLCELILEERERRELDALWDELNFVTNAPLRQYQDFIFFERAEPPRFMFEAEFDFARSEDKDAAAPAKLARLAELHLAKAHRLGANEQAAEAILSYYTQMSAAIRQVERARPAAEPSHLRASLAFAERAYRRPLAHAEREELLAFYRRLRNQEGLGHEDALRDTLVSVLLSPQFCYRHDLAGKGAGVQPLSDYALASRLSYFLWSSVPDAELLAHAAAGDLHKPEVLTGQARRMLKDPKVRGLALEFAGNWLDFRRFEEHNAVDRERFPTFTNGLRQAMFEEPVRYFIDIIQRNRSVLDLLHGRDTFVNPVLAKHYGIPGEPAPGADGWYHVPDAGAYGRGGLLPMAVFLTKNAPGLRTSPVKRGYWVVRRLLGETIPAPPPTVPELPKDEANLGELTLPELLARHRADKACAGCHRRFDAVGLAFEGFGPIGERRDQDLAGHPVQVGAMFPDGKDRTGLAGLRDYLRDVRQDDFLENLCRKLLAYGLGRGLLLSDEPLITEMRRRLAAEGYAFGSLVEVIVTSPQFLNRRGRD